MIALEVAVQVGEVLNGYRITTPPTNAGGGMSQWSFAEKDGSEFFFKMFLAPKFPLDDGPGSASAKARKRDACLAFEERHLEIADRLGRAAPGSGNLVIPRDFFRVDATYVKVMNRVLAVEEPAVPEMTPRQRLVFLRSLAHSLKLLHDQDVVHGDLKPDNVLVQEAGPDLYTSMLIDFDEGYVVGKPPSPEHIVGDPSYYSPELLRYIKQDDRLPDDALTTASDMFSFGLLLHWFLTGHGPNFDRDEATYPAEALLLRQTLGVSDAPPATRDLLERLLDIVPFNRPTVDDVITFLGKANDGHIGGTDVSVVPWSRSRTSSRSDTSPGTIEAVETSGPRAAPSSTGETSPHSGPAPLRPSPAAGPTTGPAPGGPAPGGPALARRIRRPDTEPGAGTGLRSTMGKRATRPPGGIPVPPDTTNPSTD